MRRIRRSLVLLTTACALVGCKGDGDGSGNEAEAGTSADSGEAGTESADGTGDDGVPQGWEFSDVYGVPNLDDDNSNDAPDWNELPFDGDDDFNAFVLHAGAVATMAEGDIVRLTLTSGAEGVRLWQNGAPVLGHDVAAPITTYEFAPDGEVSFPVEFADYLATAMMTVERVDSGGNTVESYDVTLMASPAILYNHLEETVAVFATDLGSQNAGLIQGYQQGFGSMFNPVPGNVVQFDPWVQDEVQFAHSLGTNGEQMNTVIDSIRNRGLDNFAPTYLDMPDWYRGTWGVPSQVTSWDSFGNLEVSPPVTVDGVEYPFGRIYYGKWASAGIHQQMADFLVSQKVQRPFEIDTSWLCVGHVDEFMSFVPDPSSEKGFKMIFADIDAAWELLNTLDPGMSIGKFASGHGYSTVGDILNDANLVAENNDIQSDILDVERAKYMAQLGLTEDDVIRIPSLFEVVSQCGGDVAALIPGTPNLIVGNVQGQTTLYPPDPWFRPNGAGQDQDPVIADFIERMPDGINVMFLDDWNTYHMGLGEVHCGTNMIRVPSKNWWEVGMHLING